MNNEIQKFDFRGASLRTLTDKAGEPWFVAKDVCDILELGTEHLRRDLDEDEVTEATNLPNWQVGSNGGRVPLIISEPGLYKLVMRSRKPEAKEFQRWVTHEVLPQIRRTGGYIPTSEPDSDEDIMARAVLVAQKTIERKNQQLQAKDAQIKVLEPKARFTDAVAASDGTCLVGELAKMLRQNGWTSARTDCSVFFRLTDISASPVRIATCRHSVRWTSACSASRRPPSPMRMVTPRSVVLRRSRARGSAISSTGTGVALSRRWKRVRDGLAADDDHHAGGEAFRAETPEEIRTRQGYLAQLRFRGQGPRFIKHGRMILYPETAVAEWLEEGETNCTRSIA